MRTTLRRLKKFQLPRCVSRGNPQRPQASLKTDGKTNKTNGTGPMHWGGRCKGCKVLAKIEMKKAPTVLDVM